MKLLPSVAAASLLVATLPAFADPQANAISLDAPVSGATLRSDAVSMSAYYTEPASGVFEVVAVYSDRAQPMKPKRIVMALSERDTVRFGLPGHPTELYTFSRDGDVVNISSTEVLRARHAASEPQS